MPYFHLLKSDLTSDSFPPRLHICPKCRLLFDFYCRFTMIRVARQCSRVFLNLFPDSVIQHYFRNPIVIKQIIASGFVYNPHYWDESISNSYSTTISS